MARIFTNVSPFGDVQVFNKTVAFGEDITVTAEQAERLAEQPLHWLEKVAAKVAKKKAPAAD